MVESKAQKAAGGECVPIVGRYLLGREIGAGGMATVHVGRLLGPGGFARTVAIKRLREELARDREFVQMFLDEARIAARVQHANVGQTLDVVTTPNEVLLVMEYVHGESLGGLRRSAAAKDDLIPPAVACSVMLGVLRGLHAAHESRGEHGQAIGLVHRDISPENVIVGVDGTAKVLDFGIVVAADRVHYTTTRLIKGKLGYMSPEQTLGEKLDRRSDVFACGIVLWETLAGVRLFRVKDMKKTIEATRHQPAPRLADIVPDVSEELDEVLARALAKDPADRFQTAEEMAEALEAALAPATTREVGEWVQAQAREFLVEREAAIAALHGDGPRERAGVVSKTKILAAPRFFEPEVLSTEDVSVEVEVQSDPRGTMLLPPRPPPLPRLGSQSYSIPPPPPSHPAPVSVMPPPPSSAYPSMSISGVATATAPAPIYVVESRFSAAIRVITMLALGASIMIVITASIPGTPPVTAAAQPPPPVVHVAPPPPPASASATAPPKMRAPISPRVLRVMRSQADKLPANPYDRAR